MNLPPYPMNYGFVFEDGRLSEGATCTAGMFEAAIRTMLNSPLTSLPKTWFRMSDGSLLMVRPKA